ncbi:MAG: hypothetical protein Q7T99_26300 [Pseudomonas sp.]|nr:hypothetical protein [Pseudomonas sp.]
MTNNLAAAGLLDKSVLAPQRRNNDLFSPGIDEDSSENGLLVYASLQLLSPSLFEFHEALSFANLQFTGNKKGAIGALVWFTESSESVCRVLMNR